ncbi:MAG: Gfo/Idh/MocA family protein [Brevinema sp.]
MTNIKLGILGASEIAFRRFLPALNKHKIFEYCGLASYSPEKVGQFQNTFGGEFYPSYEALLDDSTINAVYIPLPPALHYKWAKKALQKGKHVLLEKPSTTKLSDTEDLIHLAQQNNLALYENYMFVFHKQLYILQELLQKKIIGNIREYRIDFGFPKRMQDDFRYDKSLGGGALLDCGGYPIKLASILLGDSIEIVYSSLTSPQGYNVDLFGTAVLKNNSNHIAKVSFGMDNAYKCSIEVWGSEGIIYTDRIFTAPEDFTPIILIKKGTTEEKIVVDADDQFYRSIDYFYHCINDKDIRSNVYKTVHKQSYLIEQIKNVQ